MRIIALLVILLFCSVGVSSATNYYVNNSWSGASDSNNGLANTNTSAWLTIQKAANTMVAGDTVYVYGSGIYNEDVVEGTSGSSGNYISYIGINDPVIDGTSIGFKSTGDYVLFDNFTIINASSEGIWTEGKYNIVIHNNMDDWSLGAIGILLFDLSNNTEISYNTINTPQNAIYLRGIQGNINVSHNTINTTGIGYGTMYFWMGAKYDSVFNYNIIRGGRNGFAGGSLWNATIIGNNIEYHSHNALNLHSTTNSLIKNNWIGRANEGHGPNGIFTATESSAGQWWENNIMDGNSGDTSSVAYKCCNAKNFTLNNTIMHTPAGYGIQFLYGFSSTGQNASGNVVVSNATFTSETGSYGINFAGTQLSGGDYLIYDIKIGGFVVSSYSYSYAGGGFHPNSKAYIINSNVTDVSWASTTGGKYYFGYPLDIYVTDISGNPIPEALITLDATIPSVVYELSNGCVQNTTTVTTSSNGHSPLPYGNQSTSIAVIDYMHTNSGTTSSTFNISVSKTGYDTNSSVTNINPDSSWYRTSLNSYENTITILLSASSGTPTPTNLNYTKGDSWINHTWSAGVGNVTDSYNISINGTWYNITTDTFYNHTGLSAEMWSNSTVQAWNSTYSELSNSVSQNVQIPGVWSPVLNHIYAPNILNRICSNGTVSWIGKQPVQSDIDVSASGFNVVIS